jgi:hypothetical protein
MAEKGTRIRSALKALMGEISPELRADLATFEAAVVAAIEADFAEAGKLHAKNIAQAYQVIGALATVTRTFDTPEVQTALDYFGIQGADGFDPNWPVWTPPGLDEWIRDQERLEASKPKGSGNESETSPPEGSR